MATSSATFERMEKTLAFVFGWFLIIATAIAAVKFLIG